MTGAFRDFYDNKYISTWEKIHPGAGKRFDTTYHVEEGSTGDLAIASLEAHRHAQSRAEVRHQLHQQFDCWLDTLEQEMKQSKPTLSPWTEAVFHRRQELTQ